MKILTIKVARERRRRRRRRKGGGKFVRMCRGENFSFNILNHSKSVFYCRQPELGRAGRRGERKMKSFLSFSLSLFVLIRNTVCDSIAWEGGE
jgi:hypothetical protein